jgi:transketolase
MNSAVASSVAPVRQHLDQLCVNTIRTLSIDGVQAANSGHAGTPKAMALVAYCLWQQFLRFDPQDLRAAIPNSSWSQPVARSLSMEAYEQLTNQGVRRRLVSMPSWELFDDQDKSYRESGVPPRGEVLVSFE